MQFGASTATSTTPVAPLRPRSSAPPKTQVPASTRQVFATPTEDIEAPRHGARLERTLVVATDLVLLALLCVFASSLTLTAVTAVGAILTWRASGLYTHRIALSVLDDLPTLTVGVLVGLAPGVAAALVVPTGLVGGSGTLQVAVSVLGAVTLSRTLSYTIILRLRRSGLVTYPTVLIGAGPAARSIVERIETHPESGLHVVGTIANQGCGANQLPLLGRSTDLATIVERQQVSNIVIGYGGISSADLVDVLRASDRANLEIHVVPRLFELASRRGSDDHIWGLPLVRLRAPANRRLAWHAKRAFDVATASLGLVLASPVMLTVALLVRVSLGPGIIFTQTRVGLNGQPFELMKFRSMARVSPGQHAIPGQPGSWTVAPSELGRVGRFIRRYSLDELPQLFNVLRGDMSLVGPRPERPEYVDKFIALFPPYTHRHRVSVGMTGLAAVNGLRGDTSIEERAKFDNWYIDNWSLWLDMKILVRTLSAVLRGTGE